MFDKWKELRKFIEIELENAQENYDSIIERELELILEHINQLENEES